MKFPVLPRHFQNFQFLASWLVARARRREKFQWALCYWKRVFGFWVTKNRQKKFLLLETPNWIYEG